MAAGGVGNAQGGQGGPNSGGPKGGNTGNAGSNFVGGSGPQPNPNKPNKPTPGQNYQNSPTPTGPKPSTSIQTSSPMASSGAITQPTAPAIGIAPQLPVVTAPGAGSGSGVVSMPGAGSFNQSGPDANDSLLDLYDQLMDAQRMGGDASGGDLGEVGTSMFNSFPEFAASSAGRGLGVVALIALVGAGVYIMRKAA
jgi:hypothetical protein